MIHQNYQQGVDTALTQFGVKQAGMGSNIKNILIGNPGEYLKQLRSGKLFSRKGLIAESLDPVVRDPAIHPTLRGLGTAANTALIYGLPAYSVYRATTADPGQRGSAVGSAIGSTAGGFLGWPLGLLGQMGGSRLGSALGEALGRNFNRSAPAPSRKSQTSSRRPMSEVMAAVTGRPSS